MNLNYKPKPLKSLLASSLLISTIIIPFTSVSASEISPSSNWVAATDMDDLYNDFKTDQYWSNDMLWMIENKYIGGYKNMKHPTNPSLGVGNWLNPYGDLTENQLLTVLFKYAKPSEVTSTKPSTSWGASVNYQLAQKYGIQTKGSLTNKAPAGKVTTRGVLAQAMATLYFGKPVTVAQGVQFMYDAGLSSGKVPSNGKTYANFGVNDPLKRAHIASFVKGYDEFLKSGKTVKLSGSSPSTNQPPASESTTVNGMKVLYGKHTYGSANQAEYDKVISIAKSALSNWQQEDWTGGIGEQYYEAYLNGQKPIYDISNPAFRQQENKALMNAESTLKDLVNAGISKGVASGKCGFTTLSKIQH